MRQSPHPDPGSDSSAAPGPAAAGAVGPVIGERVHNYEIVSKIGEGGMGTVYLASHQFFERKAALKVLHPSLGSDENSVRRFMNEARAANAIRHPNIIEVVDTGFLPRSGAPYLLTEYLEGESLGARLRRLGRLPFDTALQIAGQTTSALEAAHDQGIVHRDLKPENLFLLPRPGNADLVKVLDFGIAKLRMELAGAAIETAPGTVVGTPRYMSPEQCRGGSWPVDHRTDIYSLGLILYEMLAGVRVFDSDGVGELMTRHLGEQPERLRAHVPDVPAYVEAAVMRCLAKQPAHRFASMRELRQALGSAAVPRLAPTPGHTEVPDSQTAAYTGSARPPGRGRWIALCAALVLAGGGGMALWKSRSGGPGGAEGAPASVPASLTASGTASDRASALPAAVTAPPVPSADPAGGPPPAPPLATSSLDRGEGAPARRRFPGRRGLRGDRGDREAASLEADPPRPAPRSAPAPKKMFVPPLW
jgi:serine/threonine protein kinase